jgi:glycosyltransferase involved in cell wall biosynthesis
MRILIFWEQSAWGGVDSHLLTLLNTWEDKNDDFIIVYNSGNKGLERIKSFIKPGKNSVSFKEVYSWSYNEFKARLGNGILNFFIPIVYLLQPLLLVIMSVRLYFLFKNCGPIDILFADNGGYPGAQGCTSALLAARFAGIKGRVLMVHHAASKFSIFLLNYEKIIDRFLMSSVDLIICPSFATRQSLLDFRYFNEEHIKIQVIPNGILINKLAKQSQELSSILVRTTFEKIRIGIVGRIEKYKGHQDVLCAISLLPENIKEQIELYIIGNGENDEIEELKLTAEFYNIVDKVIFTGYVNGDSCDIISTFDILVSATRTFEGFGLTIAEALVANVPVIATSVGAVPEFFNEIVSIVKPVCPIDIKEAILDFINHPQIWKERTLLGKNRIQMLSCSMAPSFRRAFELTIKQSL